MRFRSLRTNNKKSLDASATGSKNIDASCSTVRTVSSLLDEESSALALNSRRKRLLHPNRSVQWANMDVRYYSYTLGDNPSVEDGPPIAMGEECLGEDTFSIDEFESQRPPRQVNLIVPKATRVRLLKEAGYDIDAIINASTEIWKIKQSRERNAKQGILEKWKNGAKKKAYQEGQQQKRDSIAMMRQTNATPTEQPRQKRDSVVLMKRDVPVEEHGSTAEVACTN